MKVAIMQPYFFPYIGYFQLISASDKFVIYDNIQYVKKGWINRNRLLRNGKACIFTIPLKKDSDFLDINHRKLSADFSRVKLLNQIEGAYRKAPFYKAIYPMIEQVIMNEEVNLFYYIFNSVQIICEFLGIDTEIIISSKIDIDHSLTFQSKILAICKKLKAEVYINAIGGERLYEKEVFEQSDLALKFIKTKLVKYKQFDNYFIPHLSILDVMMFNDKEAIYEMLTMYEEKT